MAAPSSHAAPSVRSSGPSRWLHLAGHLLLVLAVVAGFLILNWFSNLPEHADAQQTIVLGPSQLAPDSDASLRVVVQSVAGGEPVPGATVQVSLQPASGPALALFEGQTDETGSLPVSFHVPADASGEARLVVRTRSAAGQDQVEQPVTIQRDYRLLISSDKPLYQPGQVIHMRALALSTLDLSPAKGATVDFLVEDAKGNKVYRRSVPTSDFGIAAADFTLADLVNQGSYKLSVTLGNTRSEKTVEVRPYVLPKFGVVVSTDRTFYLAGGKVEGKVQADYFFGKPVAGGEVQILGTVWDVQRTVVLDLRGQTDANGTFAFSFDLPGYFAGGGLESGQAQFALEVTVIDQAEHAEQTSRVLPIAGQPLVIEAVAESGVLKPGVENIVYVLTSYPDGRPAPAHLRVNVKGQATTLDTGEYGLAELTFVPQPAMPSLYIEASDETGLVASRWVEFEVEQGGDSVLLRADRATYVVGETMHLVVLTPVSAGSVYLDIVKAGQTLSTRSAPLQDGRAEFAIDLGPDLYGTLELHAYKVLLDGSMVRDTRLVVVDAPNDIAIAINADQETYLPGGTATLTLQTSGSDGVGVQTALGLAIVDESVFALEQRDPGFAKLYFLLEQELLEPFYQVKGLELPSQVPPDQQVLRQAQDDAAKATWAGAPVAFSRPINSRPEKLLSLQKAQVTGLTRVGQVSTAVLVLIPLGLWAVVLLALRRAGVMGPAFVRFAVALAIVLVVIFFAGIVVTALLRSGEPGEWLLFWPIAMGLGIVALGVYAWVRGDRAARWVTMLSLAWGALLYLLIRSLGLLGEVSWNQPQIGLVLIATLAYLLIPAAYLLFGQGLWVQRRRFAGAVATGVGAVAALPALVVPLLLLALGGLQTAPIFGQLAARQDGVILGLVEEEGKAWPAALPTAAPLPPGNEVQSPGEPPRLRQYFPETLYWAPEVVTDQGGSVTLQIPLADSITTWRLTALASTQDGRLGYTTQGVRVFQDFFVDIDLPVALTAGDEIAVPVGVYNYLPEAQQVRLVVQEEPWFTLQDQGVQTLTIASNDVAVVYFPLRVVQFGRQGFQVTAWGSQMSDAIRREVTVVPNGQEVRLTESDWLRESKEVPIDIPGDAVAGTGYAEVKIYPGVLAQVIEGLEKILRLPHG
jgi:hypothetical protein